MSKELLNKNIYLYPCNIVGYFRLLFLLLSVLNINNTYIFVSLLAFSRILDIIDGPIARKFNHSTKFGAYLDIIADYITHIIYFIGFLLKFNDKLFIINIISEFITFYSIPYIGLISNNGLLNSHKDLEIKEIKACHSKINIFFRATLKELLFIPLIINTFYNNLILNYIYNFVTVPVIIFSTICNAYMLYGLVNHLVKSSK